ncbi:MAG: CBS domain-containing protein [Desulfosoma sp.]|uniref:CBS domain-containing protein n=1 Tax=Desulfosoma sp. TaxID=2603217 RepID=UPI00404AFC26
MGKDMVKDLMVPIEEYATVSEEATLYEAVLALEEAQKRTGCREHKHRAVLVRNAGGHVVGKVSQLDVLRALEPKFKKLGNVGLLGRFGLGPDVVRIITKELSLLENPLEDLCKKAARIRVKDMMHSPSEGEFVEETASLNEAIRQLVLGPHQSLLVTRGQAIVGVLRLTDVYVEISQRIKACEL